MHKMTLLVGFAFALLAQDHSASAATKTIVQAGQSFSETDISVKTGDHIKFLNQDDVNHNILVQSGDDDDDSRDMGVQPPTGAIDVAFDKAGKFKVRCHIHPGMKLAVDVQ